MLRELLAEYAYERGIKGKAQKAAAAAAENQGKTL
jgi:RNA polymerase sigma-70 factor (ECF subfamily)